MSQGPLLNFRPLELVPRVSYHGDMGKFLRNVPLFKGISDGDYQTLEKAFMTREYGNGTVIFRQGSKGDAFYVVTSGEASVMVSASNFLKVGQEVKLTRDVSLVVLTFALSKLTISY